MSNKDPKRGALALATVEAVRANARGRVVRLDQTGDTLVAEWDVEADPESVDKALEEIAALEKQGYQRTTAVVSSPDVGEFAGEDVVMFRQFVGG